MTTLVEQAAIDRLLGIARRSDDHAFLPQVFGLYLEHTPPLIVNLATALQARDLLLAQRVAHRIKGSSISVGASAMAAICSKIEADCKHQGVPPQEVLPVTGRLQATFDETRAFFTKYLRELPVIWPGSTPH
jgi:HPt (histidine-containing phosphotransfer) domain-containing protein